MRFSLKTSCNYALRFTLALEEFTDYFCRLWILWCHSKTICLSSNSYEAERTMLKCVCFGFFDIQILETKNLIFSQKQFINSNLQNKTYLVPNQKKNVTHFHSRSCVTKNEAGQTFVKPRKVFSSFISRLFTSKM